MSALSNGVCRLSAGHRRWYRSLLGDTDSAYGGVECFAEKYFYVLVRRRRVTTSTRTFEIFSELKDRCDVII